MNHVRSSRPLMIQLAEKGDRTRIGRALMRCFQTPLSGSSGGVLNTS
jgi:hypothetical protein